MRQYTANMNYMSLWKKNILKRWYCNDPEKAACVTTDRWSGMMRWDWKPWNVEIAIFPVSTNRPFYAIWFLQLFLIELNQKQCFIPTRCEMTEIFTNGFDDRRHSENIWTILHRNRSKLIMRCIVLSLFICSIIFACILPHVHGGSTKRMNQSTAKQSASFDPCRVSTRISPAVKKQWTRSLVSFITTCTLKSASVAKNKWGSLDDMIIFIPRFAYLACLFTRIAYAFFINKSDRLPLKYVTNGSALFALNSKMYKNLLSDSSISTGLCASNKSRNQTFCLPRRNMLDVLDIVMPCLEKAVGERIPEYSDTAAYGFEYFFKILQHSELLRYFHA